MAYLDRIERYRERYRCIVYAYVLMSNHVHLLIETGAVDSVFIEAATEGWAETRAAAESAIADITGQRPVTTLARKSIAGFKLREGMPIGCMVTRLKDNGRLEVTQLGRTAQ